VVKGAVMQVSIYKENRAIICNNCITGKTEELVSENDLIMNVLE